jgi:protein phosphatase PTC7
MTQIVPTLARGAARRACALQARIKNASSRATVPGRLAAVIVYAQVFRGDGHSGGRRRRADGFRGSFGRPPFGWISPGNSAYFLAALAGGAVVPLCQRPSHARDTTSGVSPEAPAGTEAVKRGVEIREGETVSAKADQLVLNSGGFMMPHPRKVAKGGEDSFYIAASGRSLGVADGVGGWSDVGVDPGEFSRKLMRNARQVSEAEAALPGNLLEPVRIMEEAYEQTKSLIGSSTACIVCLNGSQLHAANIGDSGFFVVRDGKVVFETPAQQHSFNFPYQIGSHGDPVGSSQKFTIHVEPGDVLIAGSDGLFDNVFTSRAAKIVWDAKKRGATPGVAAQQLATFASMRSRDPAYLSPFAKHARQAGFHYQGGKVDDITVVVSYVTTGHATPQQYGPQPPPAASRL